MTFKFDRINRYRYSALLFGLLWILLMTRWLFSWPDFSIPVIRTLWFALTTPAIAMLLWNVGQEARILYMGHRKIDRLLDERNNKKVH